MKMEMKSQQKKRYKELLNNAVNQNVYYFTDFVSMADAMEACEVAPKNYVTVYGGAPDCERVMLRFGNPEDFGYEEDFPITLLKITPAMAKYADDLTHRDFLGTLMGLGIERDVIGDIIVRNGNGVPKNDGCDTQSKKESLVAYVFIAKRMTGYLMDNLKTVKHTTVCVSELTEIPGDVAPEFAIEELIVSSPRLDGVVAKCYHLSREKAKQLFAGKMVFINGKEMSNPSIQPKEGDIISTRGHGKFIFDGIRRETKKGNMVITIRRYI